MSGHGNQDSDHFNNRAAPKFWRCLTCGGTTAAPLTDESRCKCIDIYDQQWVRETGPAAALGEQKDGGTSNDAD